jgi:DUF309 family protein family protein
VSEDAFATGFAAAVARFDAGEFFEAHEGFEALLDLVEEDERWELCLALVQVAVGYHKWASGHPGAARMLGLGAEKLAALPAGAWPVDVPALGARAAADAAALAGGGTIAASPRLGRQPL